MRTFNRGPFIDASYQVSVHLAKWFQRRRLKCEKLTDDSRRTPSDGKRQLKMYIFIDSAFILSMFRLPFIFVIVYDPLSRS